MLVELHAGQRLQNLARRRPLQRDQRVAAARVDHGRASPTALICSLIQA